MKAFIAARPITGVRKKFFLRRLVMTHARHFVPATVHVQLVAAVLGDERFAADVSGDRCGFVAIVAGFSIATTAEPSAGIPGCSSAPSAASLEISFRIPSANTPGFAAVGIAASSVALDVEVAFSDALTDLDWGSWEGSLPESSSLGGDGSPLRGAFAIDSGFGRGFKNSRRETLSTFGRWRYFRRYQLAAPWPILVRQNGPVFRRHRQYYTPHNELFAFSTESEQAVADPECTGC